MRGHGYTGRLAVTAHRDEDVERLRARGTHLVLLHFQDAADQALDLIQTGARPERIEVIDPVDRRRTRWKPSASRAVVTRTSVPRLAVASRGTVVGATDRRRRRRRSCPHRADHAVLEAAFALAAACGARVDLLHAIIRHPSESMLRARGGLSGAEVAAIVDRARARADTTLRAFAAEFAGAGVPTTHHILSGAPAQASRTSPAKPVSTCS